MPAPRRTKSRAPADARSDGGLRTALVLQGGAALGAYEAGVLKALLEPPARRLDIVTGCSMGAVMAAILVGAKGDPREHIDDLWRRVAMPTNPFVPGMFANTFPTPGASPLYRMNPMYYAATPLATYMFEPAPLQSAIEEWVDFRRLGRSATEVIVTAVEVHSGRLAEFSSRDGLDIRHVMASASLPPVFPAVRIDDGTYWDGGLISNTPLRPALNAIEQRNAVDAQARWEIIVVDLFAPITSPPQDLTDVLQRAFELTFFGKFQHDLKLFEMYNAQIELMRAVDSALPPRSPLRRHPAFVRMSRHRRVDRLTVIHSSEPAAMGARPTSRPSRSRGAWRWATPMRGACSLQRRSRDRRPGPDHRPARGRAGDNTAPCCASPNCGCRLIIPTPRCVPPLSIALASATRS